MVLLFSVIALGTSLGIWAYNFLKLSYIELFSSKLHRQEFDSSCDIVLVPDHNLFFNHYTILSCHILSFKLQLFFLLSCASFEFLSNTYLKCTVALALHCDRALGHKLFLTLVFTCRRLCHKMITYELHGITAIKVDIAVILGIIQQQFNS